MSETEAAAVAALAAEAAAYQQLAEENGVLVFGRHGQTTIVDTWHWAGTPARHTGYTEVYDGESFVEAVDAYGAADKASVSTFLDSRNLRLTSVLNDHIADVAGWRDFGVSYQARTTPEWDFWKQHQGLRGQREFAEIIEEGAKELVEPPLTTMLEIAENLKATLDAKFQSGTKLSNGQRTFSVVEQIDMTAGRTGEVTIPEVIKLAIAPIEGSKSYGVEARLRTEVDRNTGKLSIGYVIIREADYLRDAFEDVTSKVLGELADKGYERAFNAPAPTMISAPPAIRTL